MCNVVSARTHAEQAALRHPFSDDEATKRSPMRVMRAASVIDDEDEAKPDAGERA
jgi:hypothetical protein